MPRQRKIIRITTVDLSLHSLLEGQLHFLDGYYQVIGLASDTGLLESVGRREGIKVINVPMRRSISLWSDLNCLIQLIRVFRSERPDIIHSSTPKGSLLSLLAGRMTGVPHRLYTVTGLRYQGDTGAKRLLLMTMEKIACACATKVIPEGNGVRKTLIRDRITRGSLDLIHNGSISGIDPDFFSDKALVATREETRGLLRIPEDDFVFIFIGRIVADKGMNELADAMRVLRKRCKLILVGQFESALDPLRAADESFLRADPSVIYVGYHNDVRPYLHAADALVFPSYREGFPNVVLQAEAMGLPSIVTDISGCNEIVTDGVNGRIIPPRDAAALTTMMTWFLDNREEVGAMSSRARDSIISRYDRRDVWDAILNMYNSL